MLVLVLILFIFFPILALPFTLIGLLAEKKINNKKIYCAIFSIIASITLFCLYPDSTMDLYRYYNIMHTYSNMSFNNFSSEILSGIEPLMNIIFFIFSQMSNHHLLVLFVGIISYFIQFYIIFDYQKKVNLSNFQLNIIIIYFISTFLIIYHIAGIRLCLGRMIFLLALYMDFFKNKHSLFNKLLYVVPIFIHQSILIFLILRICLFLNKNKFDLKFAILMLMVSISPRILISFTEKISSNVLAFSKLTSRAESYLSIGNSVANIYKLQFALMIFIYLVIAFMKYKKISTNNKFVNYTLAILSVGLFFSYSSSISTRFISTACSFTPIIFMDCIKNILPKDRMAFVLMLMIFSAFYVAFQFVQFKVGGVYVGLFTPNFQISFICMILIFLYFIILLISNTRKASGQS